MRPNLFVVGAMKCGTTSLFEYLSRHPQIFTPSKKETHFYAATELRRDACGPADEYNMRAFVFDECAYLKYFEQGAAYDWAVDVSPSYLYYPSASQRIIQDVPEARIVAILRDPVEKAYSQYLHMRRVQQESLSFEAALDAEHARIAARWSHLWRYVDSSKYARSLGAYIDTFGRDRVHVLYTEELAAAPEAVLGRLYEFLGARTDVEIAPTNRNKSGRPRSKALARFPAEPGLAKRVSHRVVPEHVRGRLALKLTELNTGSKTAVPPTVAERLEVEFADSVHALSQVTGEPTPWRRPVWTS